MTRKELTQFSRFDLDAFIESMHQKEIEGKLDVEKLSLREKAMMAFVMAWRDPEAGKQIELLGGIRNIQRVRVFDGGKPDMFQFEYALVKSAAQIADERRRAAAREAGRKFLEAAVAAVATASMTPPAPAPKPEPKAKPGPKPVTKKDKEDRRRFLLSKEGKKAAFDAAWKQRRDKTRLPPAEKPLIVEKVKRLPSRSAL